MQVKGLFFQGKPYICKVVQEDDEFFYVKDCLEIQILPIGEQIRIAFIPSFIPHFFPNNNKLPIRKLLVIEFNIPVDLEKEYLAKTSEIVIANNIKIKK